MEIWRSAQYLRRSSFHHGSQWLADRYAQHSYHSFGHRMLVPDATALLQRVATDFTSMHVWHSGDILASHRKRGQCPIVQWPGPKAHA
jgi:hypothetical protein